MDRQEVIRASKGKHFCDLTLQDKNDTAFCAIQYGYNMRNQGQVSSSNSTFMQNEFVEYLDKYYPHITKDEIQLAIAMGVRAELGNKDTFVTTAACETWVKLYMTNIDRVTWLEEERKGRTAPATESKTRADYDEEWREMGRDLFIHYRDNGTLYGDGGGIHCDAMGAKIYDMLLELGIVREPDAVAMQGIEEQLAKAMRDQKRSDMNAVLNARESKRACLCLEYNFRQMMQ